MAADEAANWAMDEQTSFLWAADQPASPSEAIVVYADGGCRAKERQGRGPASSASVLLAWAPGSRTARLLQVRAIFWTEATAAEAEVGAAALAAWAVISASDAQELSRPGTVTRSIDSDVSSLLQQLQTEYFYQGIHVVGKYIA